MCPHVFCRYAQELNAISMFHLRVMLWQMLTKEGVPNVKEWEDTLLKLALQITGDLTFTSHCNIPMSFSINVRQHVKIKKIPGSAPHDSEYVDGAVITKNVTHKQMARTVRNPRVMLVTLPFEFHRVEGQYMHLDLLINQEKQYLTNLMGRVAALCPHVVLVKKSVSHLALKALVEHNIAVACTVKPSVIQFIARMTQVDVFSSIQQLDLKDTCDITDVGLKMGCRAHRRRLRCIGEGHGRSEHVRRMECIGMDREGPDTWGLQVYGHRTYAGGLGGACG